MKISNFGKVKTWYIISSPYLYFIAIYSSFIVCLLFICPCGSHRLLFVFCSFIVRSLFVFCSSFVRSLFVYLSSLRHYIPPLWGSQRKLGMCKGEVTFLISLSARAARTVICSSFVRLAPSFLQTLFNFLIFQFFNLLIKIPYDLSPAILSPPPTLVLFSLYSP